MKLVCLDTNLLIWGIQQQSKKGQEEMIPRTKIFIDSLAEDKETFVLVPTVVIAEYLMPIPQREHAAVINLFNKRFIVAPFDALAASKFALIWNTNKSIEEAEKSIANGATRAELKADSMIVAIAVARNVGCIYSHDNGVKTFAKGFVEVKDIPIIERQTAFPDEPDKGWGKPSNN